MGYEWIVYALLSAITAGLVAVFGKMGLESVDSNTATFIRAIIMVLFLFVVVLIQGKLSGVGNIVKDFSVFKFIIISGVAGALSWLFYFFALNSGKVSQVVPIDRLSIVFALIFSFLFLRETIDLKTIVGTVVMLIGSLVIIL